MHMNSGKKNNALARVALATLVALQLTALSSEPLHCKTVITNLETSAMKPFKEGMELVNAGKYPEAIVKFSEACKLAPDFPEAQANFGLCLMKLGKAAQAEEKIERAYDLDPKSESALVNLGTVKQMLGKTDESFEYLNKYLAEYPHGAHVQAVQDMMANFKGVLKQRENIPSSAGKEDYFEESTAVHVARWDQRKMPLHVLIKSGIGKVGYTELCPSSIEQAMEQWSAASNGKISFTLVNGEADADIICEWTDNPKDLSTPMEGGECRVSYESDGAIFRSEIIILTKSPKEHLTSQSESLLIVCLHELGHGLGLSGHSSQLGDSMFAFASPMKKQVLSERDKKTIQKLYSMEQAAKGAERFGKDSL